MVYICEYMRVVIFRNGTDVVITGWRLGTDSVWTRRTVWIEHISPSYSYRSQSLMTGFSSLPWRLRSTVIAHSEDSPTVGESTSSVASPMQSAYGRLYRACWPRLGASLWLCCLRWIVVSYRLHLNSRITSIVWIADSLQPTLAAVPKVSDGL